MRRFARGFSTAAGSIASRSFYVTPPLLERVFGIFQSSEDGEKRIFSFNHRTKIADFQLPEKPELRDNTLVEFDVEKKDEKTWAATNVAAVKAATGTVFSIQKNGAGLIQNDESKELHALLSASAAHQRCLFPGVSVEASMYDIRGLRLCRIRRIVNRGVVGTIVKAADSFYIARVTTADNSTQHFHIRRGDVRCFGPLAVGDAVTFDVKPGQTPEEGKLPSASNVQLAPIRNAAPHAQDGKAEQRQQDADAPADQVQQQRRRGRGSQQQQKQQQQRKPAPDDDLDLDDANLFKS